MSVQEESGLSLDSTRMQIILLRINFYKDTGKEAKYIYLGYHEWDCLLMDAYAQCHYDINGVNMRFDGCTVIPVNKLSHIGVGI